MPYTKNISSKDGWKKDYPKSRDAALAFYRDMQTTTHGGNYAYLMKKALESKTIGCTPAKPQLWKNQRQIVMYLA